MTARAKDLGDSELPPERKSISSLLYVLFRLFPRAYDCLKQKEARHIYFVYDSVGERTRLIGHCQRLHVSLIRTWSQLSQPQKTLRMENDIFNTHI